MKMKYYFYIFLLPFFMNAQEIAQHRWDYRVLVVTSPTFENKEANLQKKYLQLQTAGLKDRKLKVYHITKDGYTLDFNPEILKRSGYIDEPKAFKVSLIGLDGTVKYESEIPKNAAFFFTLIDGMPL